LDYWGNYSLILNKDFNKLSFFKKILRWFNNFLNYFLFNYIITKIVTHEIEYQHNTEMFVQVCNNLIKNNFKQVMKFDF
jgi:hypothetical protein